MEAINNKKAAFAAQEALKKQEERKDGRKNKFKSEFNKMKNAAKLSNLRRVSLIPNNGKVLTP